jgi:hypothetical protein
MLRLPLKEQILEMEKVHGNLKHVVVVLLVHGIVETLVVEQPLMSVMALKTIVIVQGKRLALQRLAEVSLELVMVLHKCRRVTGIVAGHLLAPVQQMLVRIYLQEVLENVMLKDLVGQITQVRTVQILRLMTEEA